MPEGAGCPTAPRRSLLASTTNTRDLGGYPTVSGGITVRGRVWRSDCPTEPNKADVRLLRAAGITAVVDLRTEREAERKPCVLAELDGFSYRRFPIAAGSTPPATPEEVPLSYLDIAAQPEAAEALRTIAEAGSGVLYCCTAGKDRTGVISAILLLACGVDHPAVVGDYAVSREYNRERLARYLAEHPDVDRRVVLASEASMERFIRLFLDRYGSVEGYFARMKLTPEHLAAIRRKLLEVG